MDQQICINSCSVYNQKLIYSGLVTISDLYGTNAEFKGFKEPLRSNLSPIDHYLLFSLHSALPQEWCRALKVNKTAVVSNARYVDLSSFSLHLAGEKVDVEKVQSRSLYERLISKISTKPTAMKKCNEAFNTETFHLDWERIYSLPFKVAVDTKLREFQYKIRHRICYTNDMLFKFRIVDSPLCYFCGEEIETLEHFFFFCERVRTFWKELNTVLKSQKITSSSFDIKDVIFGLFHPENNSILVNYIILESKYFIYRSKLNKTSLSTPILLTKCIKSSVSLRGKTTNYTFTIKNRNPSFH